MDPDSDLEALNRDQLVAEVKRLRAGIRTHRDSTGHDLAPSRSLGTAARTGRARSGRTALAEILRGCLRYREALERELPDAPKADFEYDKNEK
jgi:hypothetical protein